MPSEGVGIQGNFLAQAAGRAAIYAGRQKPAGRRQSVATILVYRCAISREAVSLSRRGLAFEAMMLVLRSVNYGLRAVVCAVLFGCAPDYSPNIYSGDAVQQANKVEPGVIIGFRQVTISADGTVGAVTGGAAGGILGTQADASKVTSALGALGGSVVGGAVGTTIQHVVGERTGWEYIVRKPNGDLLSVTQEEPTPLPIGQKVLVITGKQARIVADYSVDLAPPPAASSGKEKADQKQTPQAASPPVAATSLPPAAAPREAATPEASQSAVIPAAATTSAPQASAAVDAPPTPSSESGNPAPSAPAAPAPPAATGNEGNPTAPNTPLP